MNELGDASGDDLWVNFSKKHITEYLQTVHVLMRQSNVELCIDKSSTILDLGCGEGNSILAFSEYFPQITDFIAVDNVQDFNPEIQTKLEQLGKRIRTNKQTIQQYLQSAPDEMASLTFMNGVTNHRLNAPDYNNLSRVTANSGYVLETSDTFLDTQEMVKYFTPLVLYDEPKLLRLGLWQKKSLV